MKTLESDFAVRRNLVPLVVPSCTEMTKIDDRAQERFFISSIVLMENAGVSAYEALWKKYWKVLEKDTSLLFIAGKGNNGGDALVIARHAYQNGLLNVSVLLANGEPNPDTNTSQNLRICRAIGIPVHLVNNCNNSVSHLIKSSKWIIDGITGTGLRNKLSKSLTNLIKIVNDSNAQVVAVDIPSGLSDNYKDGALIHAKTTVTVGLPKRCLYFPQTRHLVGEIIVVPAGFPKELLMQNDISTFLLTENMLSDFMPAMPINSHKGMRGHVAVFASSPGMIGAGQMAAQAANRAGAGLVTIYADKDVYSVLSGNSLSIMCELFESTEGEMSESIVLKHQSLLVGPGWGTSASKRSLLSQMISLPISGVIDADGITILSQMAQENYIPKFKKKWIITPHPGEMARLLNMSVGKVLDDPFSAVSEASKLWNAVVVLKGHITYISAGKHIAILDRSNPALATAGSGDVLAGIISGLLSRGVSTESAAYAGVLIHANAGELAYSKQGWFAAEELLSYVGKVACAT